MQYDQMGDIHWCVHRHMDEGVTETHSDSHTLIIKFAGIIISFAGKSSKKITR